MPLRLAINGYGRIGRCFLRALLESPAAHNLQVVAINEPANLESMAYLTRFDSTHGRFPGSVDVADGQLLIDGRPVRIRHADADFCPQCRQCRLFRLEYRIKVV